MTCQGTICLREGSLQRGDLPSHFAHLLFHFDLPLTIAKFLFLLPSPTPLIFALMGFSGRIQSLNETPSWYRQPPRGLRYHLHLSNTW